MLTSGDERHDDTRTRIGGAPPPAAAESGVELFYTPSESLFAAVAPAMVALGWSVFPQETTGERRLPGKVFGAAIKWGEEGYNLKNKLPSADTIDLWSRHCATLNVACVFGPASGHTFAVDIDVTDEKMAEEVEKLADEILGYTPLRRVGRAPKLALIYRHGPGENNRVPSGSRFFAQIDANGNASRSEHGLEILGEGKLITFHGRHHKTGTYFKWLDANPMMVGPEAAPLVTPDQVKTFLEAVDARFRFHRGAAFTATGETWQWDDKSSLRVPNLALAAGGAAWVEDADGKVSDGREQYLSHLVYRTITGNLNDLAVAKELGDQAVKDFKRNAAVAVAEQFERTALMSGRWRQGNLRQETQDKVGRLVDKFLAGRLKVRRASSDPQRGEQSFAMPPAEEGAGDPELAFLKPNKKGLRKPLRGHVLPPEPGAESLDLPEDRSPITTMVQEGLEKAFRAFFKDVYGDDHEYLPDSGERRSRVHILKAPTGAGKTSRGIRFIAADPRTYLEVRYHDAVLGEREGPVPIVFLLPTYDNINELRHRSQVLGLDPDLPDDLLRAAAFEKGLIAEDELDGKLAELRRDAIKCGLKTMVYSGKIRAGCIMKDKVELAMKAGIGTAAFCKATKKTEDGETVEEICEAYDICPAIQQRKEIGNCHVVFMPHSFLALTIPEELKNVRAVVADERIHHLFLHTATFSATTLLIARKPPRLTKREKEQGVEPNDLLAERDKAARIALKALAMNECPAHALFVYENPNALGDRDRKPGPLWVQSALRVCGNAIQRDGNLSPTMSIEEVLELCAQPTGKDVREEWRFWKIIEDRIARLNEDAMREQAIANVERELAGFQGEHNFERRQSLERGLAAHKAQPLRAPGARDMRIQWLTDKCANGGKTETIRISWRTQPNWLGAPMLLLDASAAPEVIAKVWDTKLQNIVVHDIVKDIGRALNVKIVGVVNQTFSNASLVASPSASEYEKVTAARNLANVRQALSAVAALYGDGRVVAGTSILLRRVINNGWQGPDSVDWCHYGAMRGLDMFKFHAAAFSVGRMEVPVRTIDGLVAALAYDDCEQARDEDGAPKFAADGRPLWEPPEAPFDRLGTGADSEDQPLRVPMLDQKIRLRSGHTAVIQAPRYEGRWAKLIQRQYREEELLQFVGRLRPVYREGRTPVWFALSSIIPEELIVDELVHIEDLLHGKTHLWDAARRTGGVVDAEIIAAQCPDLFPNAEEVAKAMELMGFNLETGAIAARPARGHAAFRWRPAGGGEVRHAFVRASVGDPKAALESAIRAVLGLEPEVAPLSCPPPTLARPRKADTVEASIGDLAERRRKAEERFDRAGELLLDSDGEVDEHFSIRRYEVGSVASGARKMTFAEIEAMLAINDHWGHTAGIADDRLQPTLTDGPEIINEDAEYTDYDQLGETVADDDRPLLPVG